MANFSCTMKFLLLIAFSGCTVLAFASQGQAGQRRRLGEDLSTVTEDQMTAVRATIRVMGPDVDPFNSAKQGALADAVRSSLTTVEADNVNIIKVGSVLSTDSSQSATVTNADDDSSSDSTSADSSSSDDDDDDTSSTPASTSSSSSVDNSRRRQLLALTSKVNKALMRRRLLDDTTLSDPTAYALSNQVDVLFELDSDNSTATDAVMSELALAVSNGTSSAIPAALQAQGYAEWGVTLESAYTSIPMPGNFTFPCSLKYGVFCLDGTGLSTSAVKGIIAACVIGFVLFIALLWFLFDIVHSPRKVVVVKPEDSAAAGSEKVPLAAAAGGVAGATAAKGATTGGPPPVQTPGGRFGFVDRWFQPPPSPFGNTVRVPILANSPMAQGLTPYTPNSAVAQGRTGFSAPGQGVAPTANPAYIPPSEVPNAGSENGAGVVNRPIPGLGSEAPSTAPPAPSLQRPSARYDGPAGIKPAGPRSK